VGVSTLGFVDLITKEREKLSSRSIVFSPTSKFAWAKTPGIERKNNKKK
jgi:hypothetical protein